MSSEEQLERAWANASELVDCQTSSALGMISDLLLSDDPRVSVEPIREKLMGLVQAASSETLGLLVSLILLSANELRERHAESHREDLRRHNPELN